MKKHIRKFLSNDMMAHVCEICERYDFKPWGIWIYWDFAVVVSDPDSVKEVYRNLPTKTHLLYKTAAKYIGEGVFDLNGEDIKRQRKIVLPAFRKNLIESNLPQVNKTAAKLVERMKGIVEKSADLEKIIEDEVLDLAFWILTSGKYSINRDNRVVCEAFHGTMKTVQMRTMNPVYFWLVQNWRKSKKQDDRDLRALFLEFKRVLDKEKSEFLRKTRECDDFEPANMFEFMLNAHLGLGEEKLSEKEFLTACVTILTAAFETTAFTIHASLLLMALHVDEQQHVFEEQEAIFGASRREVEMEDLPKMIYLEYVLKETLRLFPPAPVIGKITEKETMVAGLLLPKGCTVLINNVALNRNPKYFTNPKSFEPRRFSPENSQGRHPFAFNPFSYGARNCPGSYQGYMAMKTILSFIIRNFKIFPGEGLRSIEDIKFKMTVSMHLRRSMTLRLVSREVH